MVALGRKRGSGREILTAALAEVLKKPLFVSAAEKSFSATPHIEESRPRKPKIAANVDSQTDVFAPRPPVKPYVPQKVGYDASAQVENSLVFDFEFEVAPLVNVLVSKTIDQAALELHEESTLAKIRAFKTAACKRRDTEICSWEATVAEEAARRAVAEAEAAKLEKLRAEQELARRRAYFREFAGRYLASLVPSTLGRLQRDYGVFENEKMLDIERNFLPSLLSQARTVQQHSAQAQTVVRTLLSHP